MSREITLEALAALNPELFDRDDLERYREEGMPHRNENGVVVLDDAAFDWIVARVGEEITIGTEHTGSSVAIPQQVTR
jgi:hypothetical protein